MRSFNVEKGFSKNVYAKLFPELNYKKLQKCISKINI